MSNTEALRAALQAAREARDAIPLGATGKMQKIKLREQFKDHVLPTT